MVVAPANATMKSAMLSVVAARQTSERCSSTATVEMPKPRLAPIQSATIGAATSRSVRLFGQTVTATVIDRSALTGTIMGPAIINQMDTTTLVPPGWQARRIDAGALVLERKNAQ